MASQNTLDSFKITTIRLIEEFLLERITQLDPDVREEEGHIYSPRKWQIILKNSQLGVGLTFLEKYFTIPDNFWEAKYKWLQKAQRLSNDSNKLLNFLQSEHEAFINFYQDAQGNNQDFLSNIVTLGDEAQTNQIEININNQSNTQFFFTEDKIIQLCALMAATELMKRADLHNLTLSTLENIFEISSNPIPLTELQLLKIAGLATPTPLRAGVESHYRQDKWKSDANQHGVFEVISKNNANNRVEVFIAGEKDSEILALEAVRQVINLIGIEAAKLQLVFASYAFKYQNTFPSKFRLQGSNVIKMMGWDKKHRANKSEKLAELASIAFHLGRMFMKCTWFEGKPKGKTVDASVSVSPLWVIEVDARGQMNLFTGKIEAPKEIYLEVSPGPWAEKWLNRMGNKAGEALLQFGWLATEILKIDPYHDELALKLAIHLTMTSRIKMHDKNQYEHKVGTLLETIELDARIRIARQRKQEAYNLKQRWDSALTLLMSMGWCVIFDKETYPEWLIPNSEAEKPSNWRKEKILDQLWKAKLSILPPQPIPQLLQEKSKPSKLKPTDNQSQLILTRVDIRSTRVSKGVSQKDLANWAGKSKTWLCLVEQGQRKIDSKQAQQLLAGIDFLANQST
ncbi:hypothetical protein CAL7716_099980 (plasmid) [Calothrix sp. PCC 7716]|nr:hypothetical protein CAL7716_099980 [Calothrix sp. PCC 7716]